MTAYSYHLKKCKCEKYIFLRKYTSDFPSHYNFQTIGFNTWTFFVLLLRLLRIKTFDFVPNKNQKYGLKTTESMTIHDSILNQFHPGSKLEECYGKTSFETMWQKATCDLKDVILCVDSYYPPFSIEMKMLLSRHGLFCFTRTPVLGGYK